MKPLASAVLLLTALASTPPVAAADDPGLLRLASCQDSWLDWRRDETQMKRFADLVLGGFSRQDRSPAFIPQSPSSLLGFPITELYPQSVGMGLGFSVAITASFDEARQGFEKLLGKPMACSRGEGMRNCELVLGEKKTAMLMAPDKAGSRQALVGCYYYYEK